MNKYLNLAFKMRIFHLSEFADKTGMSIFSASTTLNRWKKAGVVYQIRRDLYCVNNPVGNIPAAHRFEIASKISNTSFLSYHSALEFHGLGHQIFNVVMVSDKAAFRSFSFDDCDYQSYVTKNIGMNGVICSRVNPNVRVTDLERTFVDCIDRVGRAGGAEELFLCFEGLYKMDFLKIERYLNIYNKVCLYKKVGYVAERLRDTVDVPENFVAKCREIGKATVSNFSTTEKCDVFIKEWNLYIPKIIVKEDEDGLI